MINHSVFRAHSFQKLTEEQQVLLATIREVCKKIAPVWPLENFVAVNPFLGLNNLAFEHAAQELAVVGGIHMTLPAAYYLQKLEEGQIAYSDLSQALEKKGAEVSVDEFIDTVKANATNNENPELLPTVASVATGMKGKDWDRFAISRVSTWAASYFDKGQAVWSASNNGNPLYDAWKFEASVDRTPELTGLKGFRKHVQDLPAHPLDMIAYALDLLMIPEEGIGTYLHRVLRNMGGWSAYVAQLDWDRELHGKRDGLLIEFLAVLLGWEVSLMRSLFNSTLMMKWNEAKSAYILTNDRKKWNFQVTQNIILQEALDLSAQRRLIHQFRKSRPTIRKKLVKAQAVFCIDVRSEVFRRNLELMDHGIETIGFAGFFGFPIKYVPTGHEDGEAQCPVLLTTGPTIMEQWFEQKDQNHALGKRRLNRQVQQLWKSFKSGAITCFSFVSPLGLAYLPKLFTDSFGLTRPVPHPDHRGLSRKLMKSKSVSLMAITHNGQGVGIPIDQQIQMAKNALTAMSLHDDFAPYVMIVGHGSTMVNNPHATGYDCGACGGHTGEANAKVAAEVLNNPIVRLGLKEHNIPIPDDTIFLACLHDTTTDEVTIYNEKEVPDERQVDLLDIKQSLNRAGSASRTERSIRLMPVNGENGEQLVLRRSKDWSQIRPEWGLAGCSSFVVARRDRTRGMNLEGKAFLHSYNWKSDRGFSTLELIMTAPMVVTSWINLQYYGSTVDNKNFGSGNKTLHNVTAGLGVIEGYSGDLRVGLPLQAIHDGENYQHEPLRLNVIIEAPIEVMNAIIEKHKSLHDLCNNGWIQLLAMDDDGKISHRYNGQLQWEMITQFAA